jgi:hypothetical protein
MKHQQIILSLLLGILNLQVSIAAPTISLLVPRGYPEDAQAAFDQLPQEHRDSAKGQNVGYIVRSRPIG